MNRTINQITVPSVNVVYLSTNRVIKPPVAGMDRRSAPEAERLLGGGLSDDDENLLDGERPDTQEDSRARPKQDNNYSNRKLRK